MPCVYLPGPAPAVTVANTSTPYLVSLDFAVWFHNLKGSLAPLLFYKIAYPFPLPLASQPPCFRDK